MIAVFGKGKVWKWIDKLLNKLKIDHFLMDDWDFDIRKLENADKIICSPWVKQDHKIYKTFEDKVLSELNFLEKIIQTNFKDKNLEFIGITWTNGKSTSAHIMYNLFLWLFDKLNINTKVHLSGNFWTPLSETLCEILDSENSKHLIILECSSFMLYNLKWFKFDYSILTNLWVDHLDWHKDIEEYFSSKLNILKNTQKYWVTNWEVINKYNLPKTIGEYQNIFDLNKTNFLWEHNKWNWNAIYKIVEKYFEYNDIKFDNSVFFDVAKNIDPLEHRIRKVKEIWNIKIYDDWICTSSQALNAALSCFEQKIVLIAWWYDKGDDYNWLAGDLKNKVEYAAIMGQTSEKLWKILDQEQIEYQKFFDLNTAVNNALEYTKNNNIEIILYSPGAASFDMFKNVYDRCNQFSRIIDSL